MYGVGDRQKDFEESPPIKRVLYAESEPSFTVCPSLEGNFTTLRSLNVHCNVL